MIRTSLTVMPRRGVFYGAKAGVLAAVALVVAFLASFASFFIGQALLASTHVSATLSQPNVLRAVIGSALYVVLCGLFAFGLGAILRSTAGAMAAAYGLLFLVPQLAKALPSTWYADVVRWLPGGDVVNTITSTKGASISPHSSTYPAVTSTDRSTPGPDSDIATWVGASRARPRKKTPKLVTRDSARLTQCSERHEP